MRGIWASSTFVCLVVIVFVIASNAETGWQRHVVDDSGRGADGLRAADIDGDGLLDIVASWEESGEVRAYLNPGPEQVRKRWPGVTVGNQDRPEDAVFVDLDQDGFVDVVSCAEGPEGAVAVHWGGKYPDQILDPAVWSTELIPVTRHRERWMYCVPLQLAADRGPDLVVGSKGVNAGISILMAPDNARELERFELQRIYDAAWVMSIVLRDVDRDGDWDMIASDRKGDRSGLLWLENPGSTTRGNGDNWTVHRIGELGEEVLFIDVNDFDGDGHEDIAAATREGYLLLYRRSRTGVTWEGERIELGFGSHWAKAVRIVDVDLDGKKDIVVTKNTSSVLRLGPSVVYMTQNEYPSGPDWVVRNISGSEGRKFDLIELIDLDHDGDLDLLTTEERDNLGVVWFENPTR